MMRCGSLSNWIYRFHHCRQYGRVCSAIMSQPGCISKPQPVRESSLTGSFPDGIWRCTQSGNDIDANWGDYLVADQDPFMPGLIFAGVDVHP
jgi:hypothetical protein